MILEISSTILASLSAWRGLPIYFFEKTSADNPKDSSVSVSTSHQHRLRQG